ncbi:MAG: RNase H family protein [Patescibacteria group bacterium]
MDNLEENTLYIYTDGSSPSSPRVGGIGIVFAWIRPDGTVGEYKDEQEAYRSGTNNQMELEAGLHGLREFDRARFPIDVRAEISSHSRIVIRSDSNYVVENFYRAFSEWSGSWLKRSGEPVANPEQWKALVRMVRRLQRKSVSVRVEKVKGHSRSVLNRKAHKMAGRSARRKPTKQVSHIRVRRKQGKKSVDSKLVPMLGQRITIYIVTDTYLKPSKRYRYKYQVRSRGKFFHQTALAHSKVMMSAGHTYRVRLGEDQSNPTIVKCFGEVPKKGK